MRAARAFVRGFRPEAEMRGFLAAVVTVVLTLGPAAPVLSERLRDEVARARVEGQAIHEAPANAPSTGRLAPQAEPGDRLTVTGTIVDAAGNPVSGASLYVYQTDREGYYGVKPASDSNNPRLKLFLRSDAKGAWSFETIKPGSYPGSRNPGHIHFEVSAPGRANRFFEIVFEGDPFITDQMKSNPSFSVRRIEAGRVSERITLK
jgi:protocatechuate 3,4-dioxygenase beta subunit